jgi:hypothetical protein
MSDPVAKGIVWVNLNEGFGVEAVEFAHLPRSGAGVPLGVDATRGEKQGELGTGALGGGAPRHGGEMGPAVFKTKPVFGE